MYILEYFVDIGRIAWNLQNMEDSTFGPKPTRRINLDSIDSDVVDTYDNTPSSIQTSDVETVKLSRKKKCSKLNRNGLIKLLNYIIWNY